MTDKEVTKSQSIAEQFKVAFQMLRGTDDKIMIVGDSLIEGGVDIELSIANDCDPKNVMEYINGIELINPAINQSRYNAFFLDKNLPVQPGFCTFKAYVVDQVVHIRLNTSGEPFDIGV